MLHPPDGFVLAQDGGNIKYMGAEFAAYQHNA